MRLKLFLRSLETGRRESPRVEELAEARLSSFLLAGEASLLLSGLLTLWVVVAALAGDNAGTLELMLGGRKKDD